MQDYEVDVPKYLLVRQQATRNFHEVFDGASQRTKHERSLKVRNIHGYVSLIRSLQVVLKKLPE